MNDQNGWAECAAGAVKGDTGRPARIGAFLANAALNGDDARMAYYETMIQHMSPDDMRMARLACLGQAETNAGGQDGSDRGFARFKAEAERLGLAEIVPEREETR